MKTRTANGKLKAVKYAEEDLKGDDDDGDAAVAYEQDNTSDDEAPPLKKRRQSQGNPNSSKSVAGSSTDKGKGKVYRGKNVGKLAKLLEMPVDIFCEVSVYLEPLDLLRLARSTRGLYDMLMSRNAKPIWRTARAYYADLPDCPTDLSEPEYARLLFERDCHACFAPRVQKVDYVLRARLCHRCRSSNIVKGTQLIKTIPHLTEQLLECIPCRNQEWSGHRHRRLEYFYGVRVQALVTRFRAAIPQDLPEDQAETLRNEFYDRSKELIKETVRHAVDVANWLLSDRKTKITEGFEATLRRKASLRAKLIELGYSEDDFPKGWENVEWTQIMAQPRDLTPRIWTAVRPKLEACIEKVNARREENARRTRNAHRLLEVANHIKEVLEERQQRDKQLTMHFDKVQELPSVDAMIKEDDYGQKITQEKWDAAWTQIEKEMDEYADWVRKELMRRVVASRQVTASKTPGSGAQDRDPTESPSTQSETDIEVDLAFLLSPNTFFECKRCSTSFGYPALLDHACVWTAKRSVMDFSFNATATMIANSLISSIQPQQSKDISTLGKTLQCLRCDENISKPVDWSELINHFNTEQEWYYGELLRQQDMPSGTVTLRNDHALEGAESPAFTILTLDASAIQQDKVRAWTVGHPSQSTCGLCKWSTRKTKQEVALHISTKHLKDIPEAGDIVEGRPYF